ncbi:hypothetical protein HNQ91_001135 [Filimonas zeae]|uniref:RagB/SusD family nutrient uptake outer membrane protein n=1 Tax=Filimonas zeae TaxID=1737353 RepID=A0A917ITY0_9BACT|nr:RagB/SusD family nutrient uptake outer membrane protein [Filimonas zeae]MDR6338113.1 hypothetical protein [Filimonas zeae]GGH61785.1 hypothetical protein GCM10011379_11100 [Filimonas zeae]
MKCMIHCCRLCVLLLILCCSSCRKWLDVSPETQVKESDQFSTRQGFVDALFGVYQKLTSTSAYGASLSYGFLDILAQRYDNKASTTNQYYQTARYNYLAGGETTAIWGQLYAAIAQCNFILEHIEEHRNVLTSQEYGIVKGEALGMRAFLHFELLRMYAPAYKDGVNAGAVAIPYMNRFQVKPQNRLTMQAVLELCEADLKAAETLLAVYPGIDQIADNQNATGSDLLRMYRQNHLNFWAVKAVLARMYLYKGNKPLALQYAKEVIDSKKFRFIINASELDVDPASLSANLTFTMEHVFSVYVNDMKTNTDLLFKPAQPGLPDGNDLFIGRARLNNLYEVSVPGYITDIRNPFAVKTLWNQVAFSAVYTRKYYVENTQNVRASLVPLIRLSEMYYIAAEASATIAEGMVYLNAVRTARLIPALAEPPITALMDLEIMKEYQKEFYGEGQAWFYYKRKNISNIPEGVGNPMTDAKYTFPVPDAEIEFGN